MNRIHFFKAISRLGIINRTKESKSLDIGVEEASNYILTNNFLKKLPYSSNVDSFEFPYLDRVNKLKYQEIIAQSSKKFYKFINRKIKANEMQIAIGGDHSISLGSIMALLERLRTKKIGFVIFDSHGDINTFYSSPSGNFHGIYLRPLVENIDSKPIRDIVNKKISPKDIIYIGNLDLDPGEITFIKKKKIQVINRAQLLSSKKNVMKILNKFILLHEHIHISFDIDVFDRSVVKATGLPSPNGLFPKEIFPLLNLFSNKAKSLSIDLTEVNPKKPKGKQAVKIAREVLNNSLK